MNGFYLCKHCGVRIYQGDGTFQAVWFHYDTWDRRCRLPVPLAEPAE